MNWNHFASPNTWIGIDKNGMESSLTTPAIAQFNLAKSK